MGAGSFDRSAAAFRGDFSVAPDGVVDGFCADPARPDLRCWVEILVEDRLAATALANAGHEFRAALPAAALPARPELLVRARVRGARSGFAQRLLVRPGIVEQPPERERALAASVAEASDRLEALCRHHLAPAAPVWRDRLQGLASLLSRGTGRAVATPDLPFVRHPSATLVLLLRSDLADALRRIAWLAPLVRDIAAELLVVDASAAAELTLLPSLVPNLRLADAGQARGRCVVMLDPADPTPSRAALAERLRPKS